MHKILSVLKHPAAIVILTVLAVEYIDSRSGSVRSTVAKIPAIGPAVVAA